MVGGATGHILDTFFCHLFPPTVEGEQPQNGKMTSFLGENPPKSGQNRDFWAKIGKIRHFLVKILVLAPPTRGGGQVVFLSPLKTRLAPPTVEGEQNSRGGGLAPPQRSSR